MTLLDRYAGVVCDLDGVVYRGPTAVEHAVGALEASSGPVLYATNNASRTPGAVAAHLRELGLSAADEAVVTASQAGAWVLGSRIPSGSAVLAVGAEGVAVALREAGYAVVQPAEYLAEPGREVHAVMQGYGPEVTATDLAAAAYAVGAGASWVATNTDATLPTDRGIAPGNGALVQAVRLAVGRGPDQVAGKPFPTMYELAADRLGCTPDALLAVGDRLETDIDGANRAGMDSILVLTGVHTALDASAAEPALRPTHVVPDLRWLHFDLDGPEWGAVHRIDESVRRVWELSDRGGSTSRERESALEAVRKAVSSALLTVR